MTLFLALDAGKLCARTRRCFSKVVGSRLLLLSYIPLLRGIAGTLVEEGMTALDHMLSQLPSGEAHACLWTESAGHVSPVLVLEQAEAIADHLIEWAEGDPGSWFRLAIGQHRGRYALALLPDLTRSRERFELARRLAGLPAPDDAEYCHVYRPLHFVSGREHIYESVSRRVPSRVRLGIVDRAAVDPAHPDQVDVRRIRKVGPFQVATDDAAKQFKIWCPRQQPTVRRLSRTNLVPWQWQQAVATSVGSEGPMLRKPASERWWLQRDSNPCLSLERAVTWVMATRTYAPVATGGCHGAFE